MLLLHHALLAPGHHHFAIMFRDLLGAYLFIFFILSFILEMSFPVVFDASNVGAVLANCLLVSEFYDGCMKLAEVVFSGFIFSQLLCMVHLLWCYVCSLSPCTWLPYFSIVFANIYICGSRCPPVRF